MASPVVVSRIQNRRGTQDQFNGLTGIYPNGYDGIGGYNPPGTGPVGYTSSTYPNVLMPGELALCTDSGRVFMGSVNGTYIEITKPIIPISNNITLQPLTLVLIPVAIPTVIPALSYAATPFFSLLYDITDNLNPDWNLPGTNFSKNGEIQITGVLPAFPPIPNPPFSPIVPVTLSDTGIEVNTTAFDITFTAQYSGINIEIMYTHNFPGSLIFNTSSIIWLPF